MSIRSRGYEAQIRPEWARGGDRLFLYREQGRQLEVLCEDGAWLSMPDNEEPPANAGLYLPRGAWQAIVELVEPDTSKGEIKRLEDALTVERGRVDQVLDRRVS